MRKKTGNVVYVRNNEIDRAISKLRHMVASKLKEVKERRFFEKPSDKKRRKLKEMIKNCKKRERIREMYR